MMLDAPSFNLVLTPEAALSLVQKELSKRGWKKMEVEEIRLVYTPYWVFSFDVLAEGSQPSGRAALNAHTGELEELVPLILDHPLDKSKKTDEKSPDAEVETTAIARSEVESVAASKIAAQIGMKKDNISVSAITKYYIPTYRIWVVVPPDGGETYKLHVDALLGIPSGLDALPGKTKGWGEDTEITLDKLKSPQGWADLIGATMSAITSGKILSSRPAVLALLAVVIIALALFTFGSTSIKVDCQPSQQMLGDKQFFGLAGEQYVVPQTNRVGQYYVNGVCQFTNTGRDTPTVCVKVSLRQDGAETQYFNSTCVANLQPAATATEKEFTITWPGPGQAKYSLKVERFV